MWHKSRRRERFSGRNVLITGGSSGIGLEIAKQFAAMGAHLFLVARNPGRLEQASREIKAHGPGVKIATFSADVGSREQITGVVREVADGYGGLSVLIANAGTSFWGKLEDHAPEELEYAMRVNYFGMVYAIQAGWPYLKEAQGHIGLVSSVGGYLGAFGYASYSPTKFAVTGLAECLRMEAADSGVGVTVVFPPDTDTPMLQQERERALPESKALGRHSGVMAADVVARKFVDGIVDYRFEVICNLESKLLRVWKALWPRRYYKFLDDIVDRDRRRRGDCRRNLHCR